MSFNKKERLIVIVPDFKNFKKKILEVSLWVDNSSDDA
jgi:hypothetical protein